ncbi:MAG: hypothetical protein Ta2B_07070 [Termitinemataceae bacterium]|nr:MAG: hypothetical protein Ta2B_07070 [Termitinemataceae bacterium]
MAYFVDEKTGQMGGSKPGNYHPYKVFSDYGAAADYRDMIEKRNGTANIGTGSLNLFTDFFNSPIYGVDKILTIGGGMAIGFGLKGLWKLITLPFWLMFWMLKIIFALSKILFYSIPRFLFSNGMPGRIILGYYILGWGIAIFAEQMGMDYIKKNIVYLSIILVSILATSILSLIFALKDKRVTKKLLISILSGIIIIFGVVLVGTAFTKSLIPEPKTDGVNDTAQNEIIIQDEQGLE